MVQVWGCAAAASVILGMTAHQNPFKLSQSNEQYTHRLIIRVIFQAKDPSLHLRQSRSVSSSRPLLLLHIFTNVTWWQFFPPCVCVCVCVYVTSHATVNTAYSYVQWQAHGIVLLGDVCSTFLIWGYHNTVWSPIRVWQPQRWITAWEGPCCTNGFMKEPGIFSPTKAFYLEEKLCPYAKDDEESN